MEESTILAFMDHDRQIRRIYVPRSNGTNMKAVQTIQAQTTVTDKKTSTAMKRLCMLLMLSIPLATYLDVLLQVVKSGNDNVWEKNPFLLPVLTIILGIFTLIQIHLFCLVIFPKLIILCLERSRSH